MRALPLCPCARDSGRSHVPRCLLGLHSPERDCSGICTTDSVLVTHCVTLYVLEHCCLVAHACTHEAWLCPRQVRRQCTAQRRASGPSIYCPLPWTWAATTPPSALAPSTVGSIRWAAVLQAAPLPCVCILQTILCRSVMNSTCSSFMSQLSGPLESCLKVVDGCRCWPMLAGMLMGQRCTATKGSGCWHAGEGQG